MDPKMRGDWVSRREAMTLETLLPSATCARNSASCSKRRSIARMIGIPSIPSAASWASAASTASPSSLASTAMSRERCHFHDRGVPALHARSPCRSSVRSDQPPPRRLSLYPIPS